MSVSDSPADGATSLTGLPGLPPELAAPNDVTILPLGGATGARISPEERAAADLTYFARPPVARTKSAGDSKPPVASLADRLAPGEAFGPRYHIIKLLGAGGMGAVYQAWDAELGVSVAVKVIRPEVAADPEAGQDIERRFKRELLLARQVTHKNVVRIHDLGEIDGIKYITMPFVPGADLATVLKHSGPMPVARALRLVRRVVSGLVSAHDAGVVHRDLKPANIMVGEDDEPTIMDFGIARSAGGSQDLATGGRPGLDKLAATPALLSGQTMAGAIIGTVEYMAPEQAKGEAVDQRVDVYALGLIFYDMLIGGRRSERAASAVAELQGRMRQAPASPRKVNAEIPPAVDEIIARCLEPDPDKRFRTTKDLQEALERLDEHGKPLPIVRRLTRRVMAIAAAIVAVLLGATFYTTRQLSAPPVDHAPVSVLIADFQNTTNDPTFDHTLAQALRRGLESASFITAFDRTRIRATFQVQPPERFDEVAARQLAIKQGLGVVLAGSVAPRGTGYDIVVQATEPMTGNVIASITRRASNKDQVLPAMTRVVTGVRNALGDETSESQQQLAMKTISTTSLEVASHYAAAVNAQARGNAEEALRSFGKTVELDAKFGLGYQGLAVMSRNLGRLQDSEKYAAEALRYLDEMTERERFATRGYYYIRTGDYQQCVTEYGALIAKFPADVPAHNQRALCLSRLRQMTAAVDDMRTVVKILPNHAVYRSNLAVLLNYAGEFAAAEQEIRAIAEPDARALGALALSQQGQGLVREAAETYQKLSSMGDFGAAYGPAGLGDLAAYEGRFSDAVKIFEEGAAADLAANRRDAAAMKYSSLAYVHLAAGRNGLATAAAETALKNSTAPPIRLLTARIFVETGALDRARPMADAFKTQLAAEAQAFGKIIEGGIALKSGDARQAIKLFAEANATHDTWFGHFDLGRAFFAGSAFPQADSEFDRCIQRRGEALTLVDEDPTYAQFPAAYYYLGRVREELKTSNYADAFREYLKIRGQSTEDPLLPEIRKRIDN